MVLTAMPQPTLRAPRRLVTETRADLRDAALRRLDSLVAEKASRLTIDLGDVVEADIGGIGILVLLQKRASDRGMPTRLTNVPEHVARLLSLTQLDFLFELQD